MWSPSVARVTISSTRMGRCGRRRPGEAMGALRSMPVVPDDLEVVV